MAHLLWRRLQTRPSRLSDVKCIATYCSKGSCEVTQGKATIHTILHYIFIDFSLDGGERQEREQTIFSLVCILERAIAY